MVAYFGLWVNTHDYCEQKLIYSTSSTRRHLLSVAHGDLVVCCGAAMQNNNIRKTSLR